MKLVVYHIVNQTKIQNTKLYKKYRQANNYIKLTDFLIAPILKDINQRTSLNNSNNIKI